MGAWGSAIFSDDTAADLRDDWKDLLGEGLSPEEATKKLVEEYQPGSDGDQSSVFWLALAETQWKTGRLLDCVKQKAIRIIDSRENLKLWEKDGVAKSDLKKREAVLEKLKEQLLSAQPDAKKITKQYKENSPFNEGDIFTYKNNTGNLVLFRVIGIHQDKGGRSSVCEILDWYDTRLPEKNGKVDIKAVKSLSFTHIAINGHAGVTRFMLGETVQKYAPDPTSFGLICTKSKSKQICSGYSVLLWRDLEKSIAERFAKQ